MSEKVRFTLNGVRQEREVDAHLLLLDWLRDEFGLTGVRASCRAAACGACTVEIDGAAAAACALFAWQVDGARVRTIEGLATASGALDPVQQAFVDCGAFQCGYCTPGMIMLTRALLAEHPMPDRDTIKAWLASNICRCTGYNMIVNAVEQAAAAPGRGARADEGKT